MATALLRSLFADKAIVDDREPIWAFEIPTQEGEYGLYAPKMTGWTQMVYLQLLHGLCQAVFAVIIYHTILPNRGTTFAYLVGWGILIPISIYLPFWFIETCDIQNRFVNLPAATVATSVFFRCIEAMYDTTEPKYKNVIEGNLKNYITYHMTLSPLVWESDNDDNKKKKNDDDDDNDDKTTSTSLGVRKVTIQEVVSLTTEVFMFFIAVSLLLSYLMAYNFQPFPSSVKLNDLTITDPGLYSVNHFLNAYLYTWLLYFTLKVGFEASGLGENAKGLATMKIFNEPLMKSTSPSEFWTQRWNMMIHTVLKGGIFRPARKFLPIKVAVYLTFLMSGLYHDYVWQCIFYNVSSKYTDMADDGITPICVVPDDDPTACYRPIFGRVTCFFAYIGIILLLERPLKQTAPIQWMSKNLPTFVIAQLLLLVHLPFVHWYGGDWMMGGWYKHFSIALFHIRRI